MAIAVALAVLAAQQTASGHAAPFSYLDLKLLPSHIEGTLVVHDLDVAHDLGIADPATLHDAAVVLRHRDMLQRLIESRLHLSGDGERRTLQWTALEPLRERQSLRLSFRSPGAPPGVLRVDTLMFPYDRMHQTFVNVYEQDTLRFQGILSVDRQAVDYYAGSAQGAWAVVRTFVPAGIEHILIGPDHVLFLIGLLLLGGSLRKLALIVTAFTLGHSVTLSLAALDIFSPSARIVEPAIALSIIFVGTDNLLVRKAEAPRDIRALVAAAFGLVHGFGFASVLKAFGLPPSALGWSLFSFNLGVEIGQLAIVLVVASALGAIRRRRPLLGERLAVAGSVIVILAGGYWFVERVFLTGGAV